MRCPLCDGPIVNGRCTQCGMPYRNDEVLYHLNESRSDHYKHASTQAKKIMKKQQYPQTADTVPGRNATRETIQEHQKKVRQEAVKRMTGSTRPVQPGAGKKHQTTEKKRSGKKGGKILVVVILLISVLSGLIPGVVELARQAYDEYRYSSWENTDEDQAVQDVFDTDEDNECFRSWTEDDTAYFAVDPGYGTIEVGEDSSIEPGIYSMFALDDTVLKIRIVSGSTEEIYDVEGTGSVETVDLEDGDEIIFQEYSETTDTLYLVKDLENK